MDGLRALGLVSIAPADLGVVVETLIPHGAADIDDGEGIKAVFLHLQDRLR
jgi:hypothetical protein